MEKKRIFDTNFEFANLLSKKSCISLGFRKTKKKRKLACASEFFYINLYRIKVTSKLIFNIRNVQNISHQK